MTLSLPPLRERRQDIPLLVDHFLRTLTSRHGRGPVAVDPEALRREIAVVHQDTYLFHGTVEDNLRLACWSFRRDKARVAEVLKQEEERFGETIENGMKMLEQALAGGKKVLDGETAFTLYDTFGFPLDLTELMARERGLTRLLVEGVRDYAIFMLDPDGNVVGRKLISRGGSLLSRRSCGRPTGWRRSP